MRMSFELLDICDAIYMLDGWESSKGANQEYGFAKGKGIEIYGCIERCRNAEKDGVLILKKRAL